MDTPDLFDKPAWTVPKIANVPFDQLIQFGKGRIVMVVIVKESYYICHYRDPLTGAELLHQPEMPWWLLAREEKKQRKKKVTHP